LTADVRVGKCRFICVVNELRLLDSWVLFPGRLLSQDSFEPRLLNVSAYQFPSMINGKKNMPPLRIPSELKFSFLRVYPLVSIDMSLSAMKMLLYVNGKSNGCQVVF
jgi:hypothetical protein